MKKETDYWVKVDKVPSSLKPSKILTDFVSKVEVNSIVDFGCGEGKLLEQFSGYNKHQLGIDINENSINEAIKKKIPLTAFICSDLSSIHLEKKYDIGILQATLTVINGIKERINVMLKISQIITKYLYINEFLQTPTHPLYFDRYASGLAETGELGSFNVKENEKFVYQAHHFTEMELDVLLKLSGFKIIKKKLGKVRTRSGRIIDGIEIIAARI